MEHHARREWRTYFRKRVGTAGFDRRDLPNIDGDCELPETYKELVQEVELSHLNLSRAPIAVLDHTYEEVLNLYLFRDLEEIREITYWWKLSYNEQRPHDVLDGLTPSEFLSINAENFNIEMSA